MVCHQYPKFHHFYSRIRKYLHYFPLSQSQPISRSQPIGNGEVYLFVPYDVSTLEFTLIHDWMKGKSRMVEITCKKQIGITSFDYSFTLLKWITYTSVSHPTEPVIECIECLKSYEVSEN